MQCEDAGEANHILGCLYTQQAARRLLRFCLEAKACQCRIDDSRGREGAAGDSLCDSNMTVPFPLQVDGGVGSFKRSGSFMQQPVFNSFHSEHEMLRYLKRLENRDLSLCHSMIALGSCTMKLNATSEMMPVSWPELNGLHPFVPVDQAAGYAEMFEVSRHFSMSDACLLEADVPGAFPLLAGPAEICVLQAIFEPWSHLRGW